MNSLTKTLGLVLFAVLGLGLAWWQTPGAIEPELFSDEGEAFFPQFSDPAAVAELEVVAYDAEQAEPRTFLVQQDEQGRWTIPSHHGYPADATTKMGQAASLLIGLRKEGVRSDQSTDHVALGVADPLADPSIGEDGRGTKVTFRDRGGNDLASLIIGSSVGEDGERRFVRTPGSSRTYVSTIAQLPETRFSAWIERDLLDLSGWKIDRLAYDNYSVDEVSGSIVPGDRLDLKKADGKWTLGGLTETEEIDESLLGTITQELDDIQIVGVRPKPEGIDARLRTADGFELESLLISLQSRGFYVTRSAGVVSNDGELRVSTDDGVRYLLRFGEVIYGDEEAVSASADRPEGERAPEGAQANRFLMLTVERDTDALAPPGTERLPADELTKRRDARLMIERLVQAIDRYKAANEGRLPTSLEGLTEGDEPAFSGSIEQDPWGRDYAYVPGADGAFTLTSLGSDGAAGGEGAAMDLVSNLLDAEDTFEEAETAWRDHDAKVKKADEIVEKLSARFGPWYYVIAAKSYDTIKVGRVDVVKEKGAPADDPSDLPVPPGGGD